MSRHGSVSISSILIGCVLTQTVLPTTGVSHDVAVKNFVGVMVVCATSLTVSTGFYCYTESEANKEKATPASLIHAPINFVDSHQGPVGGNQGMRSVQEPLLSGSNK